MELLLSEYKISNQKFPSLIKINDKNKLLRIMLFLYDKLKWYSSFTNF